MTMNLFRNLSMHVLNQFLILDIKKILIIAFILRLMWACLVPVDLIADSFLYDAFAKSIASGAGYAFPNGDITVYWPVGTSAIYSVLYQLFGSSTLTIVVFNLFLGVVIVWLTYAITLRYLSQKTASTGAFIVAFWPILIEFTSIFASELIFIFFILSAIFVWGSKSLSPILRAILWGTLVCAATYVRPTALPVLIFLPILDGLEGEKIRACITSFLIAAVTATILFSPWVYRNYQIFDQFVLVSANGGANLWMGNNPQSTGGFMELTNLPFKDEVARDHYFKKEAINFILHHPQSYLKLMSLRAITTYKSETIGIVWNRYLDKNFNPSAINIMKLISSFYWWLIVMLAANGLYWLLKNKEFKLFHPLIIIFGFFFLFPILTVAQDRYHMPINPFLAIFAAYAIQHQLKQRIPIVVKT